MLYKLLVKQFEANKNGEPLKDPDGKVLQESKRDPETNDPTEEMVDIIPSRIKTGEFYVYQELDETETQVLRYFTEDGKPFSFEHKRIAYESTVVNEDPQTPDWYKN